LGDSTWHISIYYNGMPRTIHSTALPYNIQFSSDCGKMYTVSIPRIEQSHA